MWSIDFWGLTGVGVLAAAAAVGCEPLRQQWCRFSRWYRGQVQPLLEVLFQEEMPERFTRFSLALAMLLGLGGTFLVGWFPGLVLTGVALWAPLAWLRSRGAKRLARFDEQLVDGVRSIANSVRAGLVLPQAMDVVVRNMTAPISQEFALVLKEHHLGVGLENALENMALRLKSQQFYVILSAVRVARRTGGDLGRVLDETANAQEEIRRLEARIQTTTAQGRLQVLVMGLVPPGFMAVIYLAQPEMVTLLFVDRIGQLILGAILLCELLGVFLMRKVIGVEV